MRYEDDRAGKLSSELRVKAENFERGIQANNTVSAIYHVGAAVVEMLGAIHSTLRGKL